MIIYENRIASSFDDVDLCVKEILEILSNHASLSDESLLFKLSFVLRELMNNAVEHGNRFDLEKTVTCAIIFQHPILEIIISDEGEGFIMNDVYYDALENEKRERRRGLKLIEDLNFDIIIENSTISLKLDLT